MPSQSAIGVVNVAIKPVSAYIGMSKSNLRLWMQNRRKRDPGGLRRVAGSLRRDGRQRIARASGNAAVPEPETLGLLFVKIPTMSSRRRAFMS